jgi:hypothetical protein
MAGIPTTMKNTLVDTWTGATSYVAVFTTTAADTSGEATGGGYARQQSTFPSASSGSATGSKVTIPVAAGTYKEAGLFSAATSGTFGGRAAFTGGDVVVSGTGASVDVTPTVSLN